MGEAWPRGNGDVLSMRPSSGRNEDVCPLSLGRA